MLRQSCESLPGHPFELCWLSCDTIDASGWLGSILGVTGATLSDIGKFADPLANFTSGFAEPVANVEAEL